MGDIFGLTGESVAGGQWSVEEGGSADFADLKREWSVAVISDVARASSPLPVFLTGIKRSRQRISQNTYTS